MTKKIKFIFFLLKIVKVPIIVKSNNYYWSFFQFIFCLNKYEYSLNIHRFFVNKYFFKTQNFKWIYDYTFFYVKILNKYNLELNYNFFVFITLFVNNNFEKKKQIFNFLRFLHKVVNSCQYFYFIYRFLLG